MLYLDGLMGHQARHVPWLLANPRGMTAWEMGVGKTAPSLRAWENTIEQGPLLVICLASARENWRREAIRFALDPDLPPTVQVIRDATNPLDPRASVTVCNWDKLQSRAMASRLRNKRWGAIIADEAQVLKTSGSIRTRLTYGGGHVSQKPLLACTDRFWPLSGAPMPNHPGELWTHAHYLWPETIQHDGRTMTEWQFQAQYCNVVQGEFGPQIVGGCNLAELKNRLGPQVNRLRRIDALDLPPLTIDTWPLDLEGVASTELPLDDKIFLDRLKHYGTVETFDNSTLAAYLACITQEAGALATIRRETGTLKALATGILLCEEFEQGAAKTVVFAYHRDAIGILAKALQKWGVAVIHGGTPQAKRDEEIDRFQTDPACHVLVGQLQAAGASINLQAAENVVFAEASWSPADNGQALSRVYRAGQTKPVFVRFTYLRGSIDEAVNRALARKAAMIAQVID